MDLIWRRRKRASDDRRGCRKGAGRVPRANQRARPAASGFIERTDAHRRGDWPHQAGMQEGATEAQIQNVIDRLVELGFNVHRSTGVMHTVLGGVGGKDEFDLATFEVMEGVKEAHRIVSPYKLASRNFRPRGTVVKVGG